MSLTIEKALHVLPILSTAQLTGGKGGLSRTIRWTHIVDNPEMIPWVREGDLLMTTAFAIKDQPDQQVELIRNLVNKNIAGILIAVGRYVQEIPVWMVAEADRYDFPVIALPWDVPFVEVTHAIHEWILKEQIAVTEQSFQIHKVLTQLVIDGGDLQMLSESLAHLLQRSVAIEDTGLRMLAHHTLEPSDPLRKRSIEYQRTPEDVVSYFKSIGLLNFSKENSQPRFLPVLPELGMDRERILAPILVGGQLFGYIWIISTQASLTQLDFVAIERGASVAALIMSREQAVFEAEQRGKTKIFESLMDPESGRNVYDLAEMMHRLSLHGDYQVLTMTDLAENPMTSRSMIALVEEVVHHAGYAATVVDWAGRVVVLIGNAQSELGTDISQRLVQYCKQRGIELVIGLSRITSQASFIRRCYQEALDATQVGKALSNGRSSIWPFERLGYMYWLLNIPSEVRSNNGYEGVIEKIAEYDDQHETEYLKTLECYLDNLANAQKTSEELYIHRNTLRQRLLRMQDLWQIDFEDTHTLINLAISIKGRWLLKL